MYCKIKNVLFLVLIFQLGYGQVPLEIKCNADFVEVDKLENIYIVKGSELKKYSPSGDFLFRYSDKINGIISGVDATNPLRVLIFYMESNAVAFLNQQLAVISDPVDVYSAANIEALVAGSSSGGGFWVFSVDRQSLILFNSKLEKKQESQNLSDWIEGEQPDFIREFNQKVYLGLAERILVFDTFGLYLTTLHFKDAKHLKVIDDQVSYYKDNQIWIYNIPLKKEQLFSKIEQVEPKYSFSYKKRRYCLGENSLSIFNAK